MIVLGYGPLPDAPDCPYCGANHYAIEDQGAAETLTVLCWCGATARVKRSDPDLVAHLQAKGVRLTRRPMGPGFGS